MTRSSGEAGGGRDQDDRIFISCIDVDWRLEGDLITDPWVDDHCSTVLLLLEMEDAITLTLRTRLQERNRGISAYDPRGTTTNNAHVRKTSTGTNLTSAPRL